MPRVHISGFRRGNGEKRIPFESLLTFEFDGRQACRIILVVLLQIAHAEPILGNLSSQKKKNARTTFILVTAPYSGSFLPLDAFMGPLLKITLFYGFHSYFTTIWRVAVACRGKELLQVGRILSMNGAGTQSRGSVIVVAVGCRSTNASPR